MNCPARAPRLRTVAAARARRISAQRVSGRTIAVPITTALAVGAFAASPPARAAAQSAPGRADQVGRPEVLAVRFKGVHAVDASALAAAVATQPSRCLQLIFRYTVCLFSKSPVFYQREYLDHTELARDVLRVRVFYYKRGWRDAEVDTAVTRAGRNAVDVTFTVREGPATRVRAIAVGDTATPATAAATATPPPSRVPARTLAGLLAPKPGQPLNTIRLDSAVAEVRDAFEDRGYGNAFIGRPKIAEDTAAHRADVLVPVAPGPLTTVSRIDIVHQGAQREVSDQTIRDAMTLKPGDLYVRDEVARSQRALYGSGLFQSAVVDTAVATDPATGRTLCASQVGFGARPASAAAAAKPDSTKALAVCVTEAPLHNVRASAGFNTADFFQVAGRYTDNYFTGTSRRLSVQAVVGNLGAKALYRALPASFQNPFTPGRIPGNDDAAFFLPTYQAGVDLQQQFVGSPRNTLGVGVFASRRSSPGVFVDESEGATLTFTRRVLENVPVSLGYRFSLSKVSAGDVYFCVNYGVCDQPTIALLQTRRKLSPLTAVASFARTDDPLEPTRGTQGQLTLEHASALTLSDFRYNRVYAEASYYHPAPLFPRVTIATHLAAGYVGLIGRSAASDVLDPQTRFYLGGARSVRGYGENQLGPRVLTVSPDDITGRTVTSANGVTTTTYACPAAQAAAAITPAVLQQCFLARRDSAIGDGAFTPRPLGGSALIEGSVELRVPVYGPLIGAVFVDAGALGERSLRDLASGAINATPGFGVRYRSPVGPVRVDVGIRPGTFRTTLPVVTQYTDSAGVNHLLDLANGSSCSGSQGGGPGCRLYPKDPLTGLQKITGRLVLHLSIGEAF